MTKKVLSYVALAVGILATVVAVFYLANTIKTAVDYDWANGEIKTIIYEGIVVLALACVTVFFAISGVKIIQLFLTKREVSNKLILIPMIVYFAKEIVFNALVLGFWDITIARNWIFALLGVVGLILVIINYLGKTDEKNGNILLLVASILGFVMTIVGLTNAGGIGAFELIFTMFMFGAIAAIYITYVVANANNSGSAQIEDEKEETEASNDAE